MAAKVIRSGEPEQDALERALRRSRERAEALGRGLEGIKIDAERFDGDVKTSDVVRRHLRDSENQLRKELGGHGVVDPEDLPELPDAQVGEDW